MSPARQSLLRLLAVSMLTIGIASADPVSIVNTYVGSVLSPGTGLPVTYAPFGTVSYTNSQQIGSGVYFVSERASGNGSTARLDIGNALTGGPVNYTGYVTANSFSGFNLSVQQPVYLDESVQVTFVNTAVGRGLPTAETEYMGFFDQHGTLIGKECKLLDLVAAQSPQTCSTGETLIAAASEISVNSSLGAGAFVFQDGDSASFQGIATLQALQVFDLNGQLIETLDLSAPVTTPEPNLAVLTGMLLGGRVGITKLKSFAGKRRCKSARG